LAEFLEVILKAGTTIILDDFLPFRRILEFAEVRFDFA
jgi:hypothetical protein